MSKEFDFRVDDKKEIKKIIKELNKSKVSIYGEGLNLPCTVDTNIQNNIFVFGNDVVSINKITRINIYSGSIAEEYSCFTCMLFTNDRPIDLFVPNGFKDKFEKYNKE
ncbi:MAG: hypothetical protein FH761_17750 [Firmicutes bacterium]|nr:hypothetical protein [Bacillota bacterium]